MSKNITLFDIGKFCENKCQPAGYNQVITGGNDPTKSTNMRFSEYIRSVKPRTVITRVEPTFSIPIVPEFHRPVMQQRPASNKG